MISIEEKKAEAVARMKLLGIFPETIRQFEEDGLVSISEPPMGAFYWAEGEDLDQLRQFEQDKNALVYMVIRSYTTEGKMDSYMVVTDYPEEWARDRAALEEGETFAYVVNHAMPDCSEFGYIGIQLTPAAGLRRIW